MSPKNFGRIIYRQNYFKSFCQEIILPGIFRLAFVFGDKAVAAVEQSDLPEDLKNELKNARKYVEGRGIRVEVNSQKDVEHIKKLIDLKVNN